MAGEFVLVVEDTELLRRIYADKLTQEGYHVFQASDGLECLNAVKTHQLDLILLDLVMPRMSGLEALESLKKDPRAKDIPVIVLSNLGQDRDIRRCLELGASDYLIKNSAKPVDVSAKIRATLDLREEPEVEPRTFKLAIRDREADADAFIGAANLSKRFWCPACEVEMLMEMVPKPERQGWYESRLLCPTCGREG